MSYWSRLPNPQSLVRLDLELIGSGFASVRRAVEALVTVNLELELIK